MKSNNIKIAIVEEGNFYNNLVDNQIVDLCNQMNYNKLSWVIKSFENTGCLMKDTKSVYQAIILNSYSNRSNKQAVVGNQHIVDEIKMKNRDCMLIMISGCREMMITAEYLIDGEVSFYYSKQSSLKSMNLEESCSMPTIYKLMDKLLTCIQEKSAVEIPQKRIAHKLKISA